MRRTYHVARADFLQRVRSRRLLVVLAVVAYLGYLVNVGQIELAYQLTEGESLTNVHGVNTAAFVGLKAGMTGSMVMLFAGFYLMKGTVARDRLHDVDRVTASTTISDRSYLAGKWLSNLGLGVAVLLALGFATVANHLVHGVGPTKPLALVGPIVVLALPLAALVGAVALLFESVGRLDGTLGNVGYFFLATFTLAGIVSAEGRLPSELPVAVRAADIMGHLTVYVLTAEALLDVAPEAGGVLPSFGTLAGDQLAFRYDGRAWPAWIYVQRAALVVPAVAVLLAAAIPFERGRSTEASSNGAGRWSRVVGLLPTPGGESESSTTPDDPETVDSASLTRVEDRNASGFGRLVSAELRLAVRGRRWWWYAGALALVVAPVGLLASGGSPSLASELARGLLLPLAFVWPIFVWSELGTRVVRHRMTDLVLSSNYPVRQLVAEWVGGVVVALAVSSGLVALFVGTGQTSALVGVAAGAVFAPSLAVAAGIWSRSSWLFELSYLMLWYVGPLNGGVPVDFLGTTGESLDAGVPLVFAGLGLALVGAAVVRRKQDVK